MVKRKDRDSENYVYNR